MLPSALPSWVAFPASRAVSCGHMTGFWPMAGGRKGGPHPLGVAHAFLPHLPRAPVPHPLADCGDLQTRRQSHQMESTWVAESQGRSPPSEQPTKLEGQHKTEVCRTESPILWGYLLQRLHCIASTFKNMDRRGHPLRVPQGKGLTPGGLL